MNKKLIITISVIIMASLFALGSFMVSNKELKEAHQAAKKNSEAFERDYSITLGNPDAKVTLVEFFDPACEACKAFYPYVKHMMKEYPGKIKLVMRYAPFHQGADYYVKVLEASRKQDKYWETLEMLYQGQHYWASHHQAKPELAWEVLKHTSLDIEKLKADMKDPQLDMILSQELADVAKLNIQKTPSFFVNEKPLVKFGYEQLKALIDSEVKSKYQ